MSDADEDVERQNDEIEALRSILGDEHVKVTMTGLSSTKRARQVEVIISGRIRLIATLDDGYPSRRPPTLYLAGSNLSHDDAKEIVRKCIDTVYCCEDVCIYSAVEYLRDVLEEVLEDVLEKDEHGEEKEDPRVDPVPVPPRPLRDEIEIFHGEPLTDRRSTFQAHLAKCTRPEDALRSLRVLLRDTKVARATHNMWAYRIVGDDGVLYADNDDDGETMAGKRMAQLLETMGATNVMVVVTRWYGGIHLGPARFRHINNVARILVDACGCSDRSRKKRKQ